MTNNYSVTFGNSQYLGIEHATFGSSEEMKSAVLDFVNVAPAGSFVEHIDTGAVIEVLASPSGRYLVYDDEGHPLLQTHDEVAAYAIFC